MVMMVRTIKSTMKTVMKMSRKTIYNSDEDVHFEDRVEDDDGDDDANGNDEYNEDTGENEERRTPTDEDHTEVR